MRVNFVVEDMFVFKYIGCSTVARSLYRGLQNQDGIKVSWERYKCNADISHYHTFGPIALMNRRMASGKTILTAHSTPRVNIGNVALTQTINKRYPDIYGKFDHIITISETCEEEIREMVPHVPVTLIPNGIDRDYFSPSQKKRDTFRDMWNISPDEQVVLTVAQISPRKGIYDFLELAAQNPDTRFVWVGGFPYGLISKDYANIRMKLQNKQKNLLFTGFVRDISEAYCAADVFFMPTYAETFGLAVLEAQSCGLPVIARSIPEFHEVYGDSIRYFSSVADAKSELKNEESLRRCAASARQYSERYDIRQICADHLSLYKELVSS
ncbi:MAG: glycosyltransferase family 4 protein [Methanomicrobiales archaeon]|nr:glycosyltransferase family 4 protein [Methanomicrobiales archaeon]